METKQRSSQSFCCGPGCGLARPLHGASATACSNYIDPTSPAGRAAKRAEEATKVAADPIDSNLLDRVLMAGALEHLQTRIKTAREHLECGLVMRALGKDDAAGRRFAAALLALGDLGAS